ncbi:hypothetical protein LTR62_005936 [Meristemomyces frigidus]|uniref:Calcium channel YVC1-like C-terminal transmembrane domain-containing protein n=1 Tax=Meristemomyces frigidus TaxID=1508187 RepID=A0AAN7TW07_9PEZI|nr:hypothetical protein LTR62_005936 [Meristemomyces frigidus]
MKGPKHSAIPHIGGHETFDVLVRKLSVYFVQQIDSPETWETLRRTVYGTHLKPLVTYLVHDTHHPAVVNALLALKGHFAAVEASDDRGISQTRSLACEFVAWRFVTHLTETDAIESLCFDLPPVTEKKTQPAVSNGVTDVDTETAPLLDGGSFEPDQSFADDDPESANPDESTSFAAVFAGLNALEIAAVSDAKKFLSQKSVQRIIDGIWKGDIIFWETLGQHSSKGAKVYNERRSDLFCRLRVPLYSKVFEVMFFAGFLAFYYTVLVEKSADRITTAEIMLYVWLASFTYNEIVEFWDAGSALYAVDFWSLWDIGIIVTGFTFLIVRAIGLAQSDSKLIDTAFDILSLEALFLVPRLCSLLSLHPYFGTLLPCLKEMTKDFVKFLGLVAILYVGFNTTFAFLARGVYSVKHMNWILIKVFFGSSYLGFDVAEEISPILGPPLMFIFVCLTNILLITSLISLLSNSLTKVIEHAREEYLSVYAVYVLEASTSNRLTYFLPPLNLLPLLIRPLRLFVSTEDLRTIRIILLKATHWPFVLCILAWERSRQMWQTRHGKCTTRDQVKKLISGRSFQQPLLVTAIEEPPLEGQARSSGSVVITTNNQPVASAETIEALLTAVQELKQQVETLSSTMVNRED